MYGKGKERRGMLKEKVVGGLEEIRQETMPSSTYSESNHIEMADKSEH